MQDTKRQVLPSGLWIVATPIGNLGDSSRRAQQILETADWILCEDTRRTAVLLFALGITRFKNRLHRFDAHTSPKATEQWIQTLEEGQSIALVTDAGTPACSDPGSVLVAAAQKKNLKISPIPGPSSVMALLSVAGFQETEFTFRGYFPRKVKDQLHELEMTWQSSTSRIFIWLESPLRLKRTLIEMDRMCQRCPEATLTVAKELTKLHERIFWGPVATVTQVVLKELEQQGELGEWCFAIHFPKLIMTPQTQEIQESLEPWVKALKCLLGADVSIREAVQQLKEHWGISRKQSYPMALRLSAEGPRGRKV
jgi:16S rRNA (cytidine1402-2'-O)-methyltransferase